MNIKPFPNYYDGCVPQVPVSKYRPPRVAIGPDSQFLIVDIDRSMNVGFSKQLGMLVFTLVLTRRGKSYTFTSSFFENYQAHFSSSDLSVLKDRGLYEGVLYLEKACVGRLQVVYAPSFSVGGAGVVDSECVDSTWVEPDNDTQCIIEDECPCPTEPECIPCNTPVTCDDAKKHTLRKRRGYGD